MSQTNLSELTGNPQTTIRGWERGFEPKIKEIKIIAGVFNFDWKKFYEDSSANNKLI
jgi:transcriptional regulator with XRE-family HTH domain